MRCLVICAFWSLFVIYVQGKKGFGPTEQEWGFVTVREGAHMFWWLHQTNNPDVTNYTERPVVVWLQGGPGASSTGFGNFAELGPLDPDLKPRNTTWINDVNVLFVDNPVGTGYSYVESTNALVTTNQQIADDFVVLLKDFYNRLPELKKANLYIFSESYGGKMTVDIALAVDKAIKNGELETHLIGVGLGDSWISPIDSVMTWAPYLRNVGAVDKNGYDSIMEAANRTFEAVAREQWTMATQLWGATEGVVSVVTANIDFYNILSKIRSWHLRNKSSHRLIKPSGVPYDETDNKIEKLMNNDVKEALGITSSWGKQSDAVFQALRGDFMKPVADKVELLLNTTDIKVAVFNGQLDLIVDTTGTIAWVDRLQFNGSKQWEDADRRVIAVDGMIEGYYKKVGNLAMYWVNRAGHMVPSDNPGAMRYILNDISSGFN